MLLDTYSLSYGILTASDGNPFSSTISKLELTAGNLRETHHLSYAAIQSSIDWCKSISFFL